MSNHLTAQNYPADDGWDDAADEASERMIKGQLLKFADWRWTVGKEGTHVPDGTRLVALATAAAWVRWEGGKPVETRAAAPANAWPKGRPLATPTKANGRRARTATRKTLWQTRDTSFSSIP